MRHLRLDRSKWSDRASRSLAETIEKRRAEMEREKLSAGEDSLIPTAERAVIDAAVAWAASTGTEATLTLRDRVSELNAARKTKANTAGKAKEKVNP